MNKEFIKELEKDDYLLVAVSGGPDSMALLNMLYELDLNLIVCNVNYKTRVESDIEEEIVRSYCIERNILFFGKVIDYYLKGNFEEFARVERYKFFHEIYQKFNCKYLVVAHHLNDSLETYLLQKRRNNIVKHYGLDYKSKVMNMDVIRPLLNVSKKEILDYCFSHHINYSIDISNYDNKYERNKIRNIELNNLNDEEVKNLINLMNIDNLKNDEFFNKLNIKYQKLVQNDFIDLKGFKELTEKEKCSLLYLYLEQFIGDYLKKISKRRLKDLIEQIENKEGSKVLRINQEYELIKEYSKIRINYKKEVENYCFVVNKGEEIKNDIFQISKNGNYKCEIGAYDEDFPLIVRNYMPGDKIRLKGGTKKINRIFIDKKVPSPLRKIYPVVLNKEGIVIFLPKFYKDLERKSLQTGLFMIQLIYWLIKIRKKMEKIYVVIFEL